MKLAIASIFLSAAIGVTSAQYLTTIYAPGSQCTGIPLSLRIEFNQPEIARACAAGQNRCSTNSVMTECIPLLANRAYHASYLRRKFGTLPYLMTRKYSAATKVCAETALVMTEGKLADGTCVHSWTRPEKITITPVGAELQVTTRTFASSNPTCAGLAGGLSEQGPRTKGQCVSNRRMWAILGI